MGMLKGKVVGEAMAIAIAEIGAQGGVWTFCVLSKRDRGREIAVVTSRLIRGLNN